MFENDRYRIARRCCCCCCAASRQEVRSTGSRCRRRRLDCLMYRVSGSDRSDGGGGGGASDSTMARRCRRSCPRGDCSDSESGDRRWNCSARLNRHRWELEDRWWWWQVSRLLGSRRYRLGEYDGSTVKWCSNYVLEGVGDVDIDSS